MEEPTTGQTAKQPNYGKGSNFHGKPGPRPASQGNTNAQRHGLRGGMLPKGCEYITNRTNALRRQVEAAILAAKGEISLTEGRSPQLNPHVGASWTPSGTLASQRGRQAVVIGAAPVLRGHREGKCDPGSGLGTGLGRYHDRSTLPTGAPTDPTYLTL
jgi:hypothetical protein